MTIRIINRTALLLMTFISMTTFSYSQTVGLVLSGGGSKGLAHIGVIKALEENNIPIDYVVGTSIGAIVGGLYASGKSPDEMEKLFKEEKFRNYYKGKIPDEHFYYFKQLNPDAAALRVGISRKDSVLAINLPTNLVANQPMDFGIMEYFVKYTAGANNDFDCLFVPFRCVGADTYNNREVIFRGGDLGLTIRASMTFPFYFKPVEIDSVLYFDGGIYNNFPVDVMRNEFAPDFTIGVLVTSYSQKPNPDDLLLQIENLIMGEKKEYEVPANEGVTISIDFDNVSLLDFHRVDEFITLGYEAGLTFVDSIKKSVCRDVELRTVNENRKVFQERLPLLYFKELNITGVDKFAKEYIIRTFKKKDEKLNIKQLESEYYKLIADFQIESALPIAKYNDTTGFFDVFFNVKKEKRMNMFFGGGISSGYSNQGFVGFNYKVLNRVSLLFNSNIYFGRLYSSFNLSARMDLPMNFPLAVEWNANINRFDYFKGSTRIFSLDLKPPYIVNFDNNSRFDVFTPLNKRSVMKLGYARGYNTYNYFQVNNFLQNDTSDNTSFSASTFHFSIVRNNQNFIQYASKGAKNVISFRYVTGVEKNSPGSTTALTDKYESQISWLQFNLLTDSYSKVNNKFTMGVYAELMVSNMSFFRNYFSSLLSAPAFTPTPHSKTLFLPNYSAYSYAAIGIKPIITFSERFNLRFEAYAYAPFEKILKEEPYDRVYKPYFSERMSYVHLLGSAALVYNTPFGPIAFSVNYYETESVRTFYMFHFGYVVFNKKLLDY